MSPKSRRKPMTLDAIVAPSAVAPDAQTPAVPEERGSQRAHVKQLTLYLPHPVYRKLRELAFHEDKRMHSLLMEGLDRLFADRGVAPIEQLTRLP